jgi:hypothetical protein
MLKEKEIQDRLKQKEFDVYEFELSLFNKVVFTISKFKGKRYINIRTWSRVHPEQQWARTQKGIFVEISKIKDVQEGIKLLAEHLNEKKGARR